MNQTNTFIAIRLSCPKIKQQYITPKLFYAARKDRSLVIKYSKKMFIFLEEDGTYSIKNRNDALLGIGMSSKKVVTTTDISVERPFPPTQAEFDMLNKELVRVTSTHDALVNSLSVSLEALRHLGINQNSINLLINHLMYNKNIQGELNGKQV